MAAKDRVITPHTAQRKPLLLVDIDGVVSLFGTPDDSVGERAGAAEHEIRGTFHAIDGIPHFLSSTAAGHLLRLRDSFELVWASGWEEKANEHLPRLLGLPGPLPFLRFARRPESGSPTRAHWKLEAIDSYAGDRPLAWIDDAFNPACHEWAHARRAPTLLVSTLPARGLTQAEARELLRWAAPTRASWRNSQSSRSPTTTARTTSPPPRPPGPTRGR